jgi:large subunit ribosomal protein L18
LIDDAKAHTVVEVGPRDSAEPKALGEALARKALKKKVKKVKFDRGKYKYHGKVKEFCEGLRAGGLKV